MGGPDWKVGPCEDSGPFKDCVYVSIAFPPSRGDMLSGHTIKVRMPPEGMRHLAAAMDLCATKAILRRAHRHGEGD